MPHFWLSFVADGTTVAQIRHLLYVFFNVFFNDSFVACTVTSSSLCRSVRPIEIVHGRSCCSLLAKMCLAVLR